METQGADAPVNEQAPVETVAKPEETVSKDGIERALKDVHRFKDEARSLKEKLKTVEETQLKEKQQWKELYEQRDKEYKDLLGKEEQLRGSIVNEKKFFALKDEAQRLGLLPEAVADLEYWDLSDVLIEATSSGKVNIVNAKQVAEKIKTMRPHWFSQKSAPAVNANSPHVITGTKVTMKDVMDAEKKWKTSHSKDDEKTYRDMLLKFRQGSH